MSDILNFLRAYPDDAAAVMSKARVAETIAEIDRLRAELAAEREAKQSAVDAAETYREERDALRALLRESHKFYGKPMKGEWWDGGSSYKIACDLYARIDAALKGGDRD